MMRQPVTVNGVTRWKDTGAQGAPEATRESKGVVLRQEIGDVLRSIRQSEGRTLRDVSHDARVSLGYLSEVERGQKEASSELLASICTALNVPLAAMLFQVAERIATAEGSRVPDTVPTELQREFDSGELELLH
ncbi:helix-turn-helix domain-containing protein [Nesterenkonia natronophila]|jgi:transcriptional regulator with XRE-family HTH domain|uniref:XRE family transcriptional regulator n=1 Tax=Nesterenkonia natronophila TaxID=2174932 RepID=A0A3A4F543_9MICC|nr:helix-turn-helix transcriptional regulator [Nesterenkonia natronophila]RJN33018.1 XRE family transcriptional regulator [Nesterenkonia natronophila]